MKALLSLNQHPVFAHGVKEFVSSELDLHLLQGGFNEFIDLKGAQSGLLPALLHDELQDLPGVSFVLILPVLPLVVRLAADPEYLVK